MTELREIKRQDIDELVTKTKTLRDSSSSSVIAEKLHNVVEKWEDVTKALLKKAAADEASGRITPTASITPINSGDNSVATGMTAGGRKFST